MGPTRPALPQNESKRKFFERLGLDKDNDFARNAYTVMKQEAIDARERLTTIIADSGFEPPYNHSQVSENTLQSEVQNIYNSASVVTRAYYVLGHDRDQTPPGNWVIRWLLWHAFRYRDARSFRRRTNKASDRGKSDTRDKEPSALGTNAALVDSAETFEELVQEDTLAKPFLLDRDKPRIKHYEQCRHQPLNRNVNDHGNDDENEDDGYKKEEGEAADDIEMLHPTRGVQPVQTITPGHVGDFRSQMADDDLVNERPSMDDHLGWIMWYKRHE